MIRHCTTKSNRPQANLAPCPSSRKISMLIRPSDYRRELLALCDGLRRNGKMETWLECGKTGFLEADVVRWTEGIWERRGSKRKRPVKIGERIVTAEVIHLEEGGWVSLLVRDCIVKWDKTYGKANYNLQINEELRRKQTTIERGGPERLPWSDETARQALVVEKSGERDPQFRRDLSEE